MVISRETRFQIARVRFTESEIILANSRTKWKDALPIIDEFGKIHFQLEICTEVEIAANTLHTGVYGTFLVTVFRERSRKHRQRGGCRSLMSKSIYAPMPVERQGYSMSLNTKRMRNCVKGCADGCSWRFRPMRPTRRGGAGLDGR